MKAASLHLMLLRVLPFDLHSVTQHGINGKEQQVSSTALSSVFLQSKMFRKIE